MFSCCSGIALRWVFLKEKNLAVSELLEALEKPLLPGILARPELTRGGATSALVGCFALTVEA